MVENGRLTKQEVPYRNALNEVLREEYIKDCERAVASWNRAIAEEGREERLALPHRRFHRHVGVYAEHWFDREGKPILDERAWEKERAAALPTDDGPRLREEPHGAGDEAGAFANWIAPPIKGINGQPLDFPYVKFIRN